MEWNPIHETCTVQSTNASRKSQCGGKILIHETRTVQSTNASRKSQTVCNETDTTFPGKITQTQAAVHTCILCDHGEVTHCYSKRQQPVWPNGKAPGWSAGPCFHLLWLSFLLKSGCLWHWPVSSHHCPSWCRSHSGDDSVALGIVSPFPISWDLSPLLVPLWRQVCIKPV